MMERKLTYLACPYSHPDDAVRASRFCDVNVAAAVLMRQGKLVFSPISHTHPIADFGMLPLGWDFWEAFDRAFIEASKELIVFMLDGWEQSKGVTAEIAIARELGIPVSYLSVGEVYAAQKKTPSQPLSHRPSQGEAGGG